MMRTRRLHAQPEATASPAGATFRSILFPDGAGEEPRVEEPAFFRDLNLDQVVQTVVAGRDEYDLQPFFSVPLRSRDAVEYRHDVFRDLQTVELRASVCSFAAEMRHVRRYVTLARKQYYKYEKERWFVDAAGRYCGAVDELRRALDGAALRSHGFERLREYLAAYTTSAGFSSLAADTRRVIRGLEGVRYTIRIKGARVTVGRFEDQPDYSVEIQQAFERFRQGAVDSHLVNVPDSGTMDHVEARIAQLVARLHPEEFHALEEFCVRHQGFVDQGIARFDREVQFYLAYLEHAERLQATGLEFSYPTAAASQNEISAEAGFDLALAAKLAGEMRAVVRNDFVLRHPERILVVTGPNQGGKTTFARMFGQLHYLASLGVPVPARTARLFLADGLFTHFEKMEDISTLRGKLDDELVRLREILERASRESIVILNEMFASTTLNDAVELGTAVLSQIVERGCLGVCVTFVDELSSLGDATVSMVAMVDGNDPSKRTFEIVRKPADGRAYAWAIAEKYGLSEERLRSRIAR